LQQALEVQQASNATLRAQLDEKDRLIALLNQALVQHVGI